MEDFTKDFSAYLKQVRTAPSEEWENTDALVGWLKEEMRLSPGRKLIRFDEGKPYGPDNCMLTGKLGDMNRHLMERYGIDFQKRRNNFVHFYGEDAVCEEWSTTQLFLHWVQHYKGDIPYGATIRRTDVTKPYSPDNVYFQVGPKEKVYSIPEEHRRLNKKMKQIAQETGIGFVSRYNSLLSRGFIDEAQWPRYDFYSYISRLYDEGKIYPQMHMHKIDRTKPLVEENAYFSWRREGRRTHGMSFTKIHEKWSYFLSSYKNRLERKVGLEEFLEHALTVRKYQLNQKLYVDAVTDAVSLDDVYFVDTELYDDINRVCRAYSRIPEAEDGFGGLEKFMEWSIRSGYTAYKDFRKVGKGTYSPETCVWDIFTQAGYDSHYKKIEKCVENAKNADYLYRKRANLKAFGGITEEWDNIIDFRFWCEEHKVDTNTVFKRIDKNKPFGPDNVKLEKKVS